MQSGAIWMELHVLHKHGWSISALAREFGLNWRTIIMEDPRFGDRGRPSFLITTEQFVQLMGIGSVTGLPPRPAASGDLT